jgi:hypothetical protein
LYSNEAPLWILLRQKKGFGKRLLISKKLQEIHNQMARVRSTARVERDGDETEATETVPISEAMRLSGLVSSEDTPVAEATQADVEEVGSEDDYSCGMPSKPSHLDFGKSTISEADLPKMMKLGYFSEAKKELIRFGGEETIPKPGKDEVVVFKSFLKAGLRFPLNKMIAVVLKKFGIYLHQLTPNAIVRLSVYIWALRSQGVEPFGEGFCRVHELHYQTKARGDGLHENFGCYNFAYRKTTKFPVISYRSKWPAGWKSEWFYVKVDEDEDKLVQSPLELTFGETRPRCNMIMGSPSQIALAEFRVISDHIGTRDLVQEFLAFRVFPTLREWEMPKLEGEKKKGELVRLPYHYKFKKHFKAPCQEWLDTIEVMCNEILGNYSKKEDQLMTAAFGTRPKRRLNRVLDALNFDYPDYEQLGGDAEGQKRKKIASILDKEGTKLAKKDKGISEKRKLSQEPKIAAPKKRKAASLKPKTSGQEEEAPATPSAAEVEEILKVMIEPLPIKLSPLAVELTKFFQKKKEPSATESPAKPKKRRIIQVADVIHQTPPPTSASKIPFIESAGTAETAATGVEATGAATGAEATGAETETAEDPNLETTLGNIDNILLKMAEEEAAAAAVDTTIEKGKEQIEDTLEEENFNFQDILGQELSETEKEELKKYDVSCGYKSGALLFGGVNEGKLRCLRNRTEAKVVRTFSKNVGLPKIEADLCRYQRQHIAGSLFYANFKVKLSTFYCFLN